MSADVQQHREGPRYTIPRPTYPIAARVLAVVVFVALLGLGGVAFSVFSIIDHWAIALAFAVVIELGAISEALAILRKNKPAYAGLAISLAVSGIYNYTRGAQVNATLAQPLGVVELWALAIGPLSATLFLALALGHEIRLYEQRLADWEERRQAWYDERQAALERRERERQRLEWEHELQLSRIATEQQAQVQLAQLKAQERADKRAARVQLRAIQAQAGAAARADRTDEVQDGAEQGATYDDYVLLSMQRNGSGPMSAEEIQRTFGKSRRTAFAWRKKLKEEHPELFQHTEPADN